MYEVHGTHIKIRDNICITVLNGGNIKIGDTLKDNLEQSFEVDSIGIARYKNPADFFKYTELFLKPLDNTQTIGDTLYAVQ